MNLPIALRDPLRDAGHPGLRQIARIELKDAVTRAYPPPPLLPRTATRLNYSYLAASLVLALILGLFLTPAPAKKSAAAVEWDQQPDIRSVYVIVREPSSALQQKLSRLAAAGVDVRVASGRAIDLPGARLSVVDPEKITRECVVLNGVSAYPLDPEHN